MLRATPLKGFHNCTGLSQQLKAWRASANQIESQDDNRRHDKNESGYYQNPPLIYGFRV